MPELAAHLERVARELVWGIMFDDCTTAQWHSLLASLETEGDWADGKHRGDCTNDPFTCHRCIFEDVDKASKPVAAALAACAREAKLEEAKWWYGIDNWDDVKTGERIRALERAAEGK